jgi:uncharacterized protein (DUF924 family)
MTTLPTSEILLFWFGAEALDAPREAWFKKDDAFDAEIKRRFETPFLEAMRAPHLVHPKGLSRDERLALLILTDQFPRNMYRDTPAAFSGAELALACCKHLLASGQDEQLVPLRRIFVYLPLEHAEDIRLQGQSLMMYRKLSSEHAGMKTYLVYAEKHYEIIARFGRFPHRNAILGRPSTPEELAFLKTPGSSF